LQEILLIVFYLNAFPQGGNWPDRSDQHGLGLYFSNRITTSGLL